MKFSVVLEDYSNQEPSEKVLAENIETKQLPRSGDYLILDVEGNGQTRYLTTDVCRSFHKGKEYNTVSVLKA